MVPPSPSAVRNNFLLLLSLGLARPARGFQEVHELTAKSWDKVQDGHWVIMFYAPWCAHCKKMKPVYEQLASYYHRQGGDVHVGRVDATAHPSLVTPFSNDVKGYPTVLLLRNGMRLAHYKGPRTFAALTEWVDEEADAPPSAPSAPRAQVPSKGGGAGKRFVPKLRDRLQAFLLDLTEMDPMQAVVYTIGTVAALFGVAVTLLCCTTTASPR